MIDWVVLLPIQIKQYLIFCRRVLLFDQWRYQPSNRLDQASPCPTTITGVRGLMFHWISFVAVLSFSAPCLKPWFQHKGCWLLPEKLSPYQSAFWMTCLDCSWTAAQPGVTNPRSWSEQLEGVFLDSLCTPINILVSFLCFPHLTYKRRNQLIPGYCALNKKENYLFSDRIHASLTLRTPSDLSLHRCSSAPDE